MKVKALVMSDSWDPMDCSPPRSSVHGISRARVLEWGCHFLLQGIFPAQGLNLGLPHSKWMDSLLSEPPGKLTEERKTHQIPF